MKYTTPPDRRIRRAFFNWELNYRVARSIFLNQRLPLKLRLHVHRRLNFKFRDASTTRVRNRCILTGRGRGVYRDFGLARFQFKALAAMGYVTGVQQSSW